MPTVMFQEHVGDYRAWRSAFEGNARPASRIQLHRLTCLRNADNENDLLILLDFADAALAKEFVEVVRKVMEAAGVIMSTLSVKFLPTE